MRPCSPHRQQKRNNPQLLPGQAHFHQRLRSEPPRPPPASVEKPEDIQIVERPGADYMVDVFKSLGFEYLFATPGSSFRGIHESVINHGGNRAPEFITCMHEECSVAMANGYAKIEGKPALVCAHGTVGLQHAAMAIYNAYCDQAPVMVIAGNISDAAERRGRVEWLARGAGRRRHRARLHQVG